MAIDSNRLERATRDAALVAERVPRLHAVAMDGDRLGRALDARLARNAPDAVADFATRRTTRRRPIASRTPGGVAMDAWLDLGLDARRHLRALGDLVGVRVACDLSEHGVAIAVRRIGTLVELAGVRGLSDEPPIRAAVRWLRAQVASTAMLTGLAALPEDAEPLDRIWVRPTILLPACEECGSRSWALPVAWVEAESPLARCRCGATTPTGDLVPDALEALADPARIAADAARTVGVPLDTVLSWVRRGALTPVDSDGAGRDRYPMGRVRELAIGRSRELARRQTGGGGLMNDRGEEFPAGAAREGETR